MASFSQIEPPHPGPAPTIAGPRALGSNRTARGGARSGRKRVLWSCRRREAEDRQCTTLCVRKKHWCRHCCAARGARAGRAAGRSSRLPPTCAPCGAASESARRPGWSARAPTASSARLKTAGARVRPPCGGVRTRREPAAFGAHAARRAQAARTHMLRLALPVLHLKVAAAALVLRDRDAVRELDEDGGARIARRAQVAGYKPQVAGLQTHSFLRAVGEAAVWTQIVRRSNVAFFGGFCSWRTPRLQHSRITKTEGEARGW